MNECFYAIFNILLYMAVSFQREEQFVPARLFKIFFLFCSSVLDTTEVRDCEDVVDCPDFTLVPRGTSRGKDLLVEAPGYSFTVRKQTKTTRFWRCAIRQKGNRCPASVSERDGKFFRGAHNHSHPVQHGCLLNKQLTRQVNYIIV